MKSIKISALLLSLAVIAGCGGSSSSSGGKSPATISITTSNADSVSKGAMTSNSSAQTGTNTANATKTASSVSNLDNPYSVASLAIANARIAQTLPFSTTGAGRVVAGFPVKYSCSTGGATTATTNIVTYDITDADNSGSLTVGDTFTATYTSCVLGAATLNGSQGLKFNSFNAPATPSPSNPETASITLTYSNMTIATSSSIVGFNGDMTLSFTYDGTTLSATMSGTSLTVSSTTAGSVSFSNYNFATTATTTVWTSSVDLSITMMPNGGTSGTINISTPTKFSGAISSGAYGNPTSGQMRIDGANGTYITITANSNGTDATVVVYDGTNTTTTTKTWAQLN